MKDWVSGIIREFRYSCSEGHTSVLSMRSGDHDAMEDAPVCYCGRPVVYQGFSNVSPEKGGTPNGGVVRKTFDKNGREAYKIGGSYISKSKYNYLETGKIDNCYTPSFREKIQKDTATKVRREAAEMSKSL